jgi:hypothetical protein
MEGRIDFSRVDDSIFQTLLDQGYNALIQAKLDDNDEVYRLELAYVNEDLVPEARERNMQPRQQPVVSRS